MTEPTRAVFLSYASQDAEAAKRICDSLRAAGIEVWFDQSELRGGDAWDAAIRKQIKACALFIPVISTNTHARGEGYFRLEWKLAVDRSHLIASTLPFLMPVVIDNTDESDDRIPDKFREVQWTRLPDGETPSAFVERISRLLSANQSRANESVSPVPSTAPKHMEPIRNLKPVRWTEPALLLTAAIAVIGVGYFAIDKLWMSKHSQTASRTAPATDEAHSHTSMAPLPADAFNPPPHSIAVLPFVNMSGDKEQEYFSEGLTEELLNSLSRINQLQVAARTSSFSFQAEHPDIATVAHKLNVGAVLEGSVRRSANTVRVTTQLVSGVTGFHVWSETYDRNLGDVLKLQTEIATAVAGALKVTLLGDEAAKIEVGGTHNPAAFDAYLRGSKAFLNRHGAQEIRTAITAYTEAIRLDPNYALAFAARSLAFSELADWWTSESAMHSETYSKAQADARKAISLAPDLAEGHLALAMRFEDLLDFKQAGEEFKRAVALAPGSAQVLQNYSDFASAMGHFDAGIAASRRAVVLDPLNPHSHAALSSALDTAHRNDEARAAFQQVLALDPDFSDPYSWQQYYTPSTYGDARAWCEKRPDEWSSHVCLAIVYDKLGRHADAEAELARYKAGNPAGDDWYQYAQIYAQWGDTAKALSFLERALSMRLVALIYLKVDSLLDPLRKEPRFQAIERALKFPD